MNNCIKNCLKSRKGITLIALVVTIIALLILAGISIATLFGDNGILQKATDAKTNTERTSIVEYARTDVLGYQVVNKSCNLKKTQLKSVLDSYFKDVPTIEELPDGETLLNQEFTTLDKYGTYNIKVSEIYNGTIVSILEETNYAPYDIHTYQQTLATFQEQPGMQDLQYEEILEQTMQMTNLYGFHA